MKMKFTAPSIPTMEEANKVSFGYQEPAPFQGMTRQNRDFTVPIDCLHYVQGQEYEMWEEGQLQFLAENIREVGVLQPCLVLPAEPSMQEYSPDKTQYILYDGRNRTEAAKLAGLEEIPCRLLNCSHETARDILIYSNLFRREPKVSETVKALRSLEKHNTATIQSIAAQNGMQERTFYRYLKLGRLSDPLLAKIDSGQLTVKAGEKFAGLTDSQQETALALLEGTAEPVNEAKAQEIILDISGRKLKGGKSKTKSSKKTSPTAVPAEIVNRYIPLGTPKKERLKIIENALKMYFESAHQADSEGLLPRGQ